MALIIPPGTDKNIVDIFNQVDRDKADKAPRIPVGLPQFTSTGPNPQKDGLPNASKYIGCLIWVSDLNKLAYSDGSFWYPVTVGAHL